MSRPLSHIGSVKEAGEFGLRKLCIQIICNIKFRRGKLPFFVSFCLELGGSVIFSFYNESTKLFV